MRSAGGSRTCADLQMEIDGRLTPKPQMLLDVLCKTKSLDPLARIDTKRWTSNIRSIRITSFWRKDKGARLDIPRRFSYIGVVCPSHLNLESSGRTRPVNNVELNESTDFKLARGSLNASPPLQSRSPCAWSCQMGGWVAGLLVSPSSLWTVSFLKLSSPGQSW